RQVGLVGAAFASCAFDTFQLVSEDRLRVVKESADQRALAVVDRSSRSKTEQVSGAGVRCRDRHQKYPSFLRSSMAASLTRSSPRVAPRSVSLVAAISSMIFSVVSASDATAAVSVASPTVR